MVATEDYNEPTRMASVPWKRMFMHYTGYKLSLDGKAASKTVEAEYSKD